MLNGGRFVAFAFTLMYAAFAATLSSAPVRAADQAGIAAAVVGDVTVTGEPRPQPVGAESGMDLLRFDRVVTRTDSRAQLLLLDETSFTVGADSELVIDEFVYDPETGGTVSAEFVEGVFRYVSGRVGKLQPENVQVETPAGTIGIRGTVLFALRDPESGGFFIGLLGPGPTNNAGLTRGGFVFSNEFGSQVVRRGGFGIFVKPGEAPGQPVRIPERITALMQKNLQGSPDDDRGGPGDTTDFGTGRLGGGFNPAALSGQLLAEGTSLGEELSKFLESGDRYAEWQVEGTDEGATRNTGDIPRLTDRVNDMMNMDTTVNIEMFAQLSWTNPVQPSVPDLDLHVIGNDPDTTGRFNVSFKGDPGALETTPFTEADNDATSSGGKVSEVVSIGQFNPGDPYQVTVFNPNADFETQSIFDTGAVLTLLRNGVIERGPGGSVVVNGEELARIDQVPQGLANTLYGFDIDPNTQSIQEINSLIFTTDGNPANQLD
ncbi:FecR family protein [Ferruginivarius sediminum]|uniref:FecR protein domain-containing protein n=1 Tax=Ferruginivarius sediminum TaxID=2661937 RepID=A0A369TCW6_9PROT|nr:FecR family protein [Ferruginivarius sediminum]RDD62235.1 hypothetical protein DRB17_08360 [Ferruginivarius sediminum]